MFAFECFCVTMNRKSRAIIRAAHSYEKCEDPLVKGGRGMSDAAVCAGAEEVLERYAATVFAAAFESAEHEKAWLLRVTINRCKSFFRSAWQRKTTGLEDDFPDTPFTPDETAVVEAVNRLPKKYRQVIYLYYIEGYATGEIAAILEMPQNTVLSQLARARKLLKTALKGEFDDV